MGPSQFLRINKRSNLKFLVTAFLESIKLGIFVSGPSGNWEELLFTGKLAHSPETRREKLLEKNVLESDTHVASTEMWHQFSLKDIYDRHRPIDQIPGLHGPDKKEDKSKEAFARPPPLMTDSWPPTPLVSSRRPIGPQWLTR